MVSYSQVATLERRRKTDYQGTDLVLRAWRVDMLAEETRWTWGCLTSRGSRGKCEHFHLLAQEGRGSTCAVSGANLVKLFAELVSAVAFLRYLRMGNPKK